MAWEVMQKANLTRSKRLHEELAVMPVLSVAKLPEYKEERVRVSAGSTVRLLHNTYSVPSRLIGEMVEAKIYEDRIELFYAHRPVQTMERLLGRFGSSIDYRHLIRSLLKKPRAFERYRYRDELFPSLVFP